MKIGVPCGIVLVLLGCRSSPPKDAAGHIVGSPMGNAAPKYAGTTETVGTFLRGKWIWGYTGPKNPAVALPQDEFLAENLTFDADGSVTFAMQGLRHSLILLKGMWRLQGSTVDLTFTETGGTTDDPVQIAVARAQTTEFATQLLVEPGAQVLLLPRSATVMKENPSLGAYAWLRTWP